jgi:hypothetical protein
VTIELTDGKGKTKLAYDETSASFDALRPYDEVIKKSVSKDDDVTLSVKECAEPLGTTLATECHVDGSVELQVAVQQGKALGATVTLSPANTEVTRCLRAHIAAATWKSAPAVSGCVRTFVVK